MDFFEKLHSLSCPIICVGGGNCALEFQDFIIRKHPEIWSRIKYFMDSNYVNIVGIKKDVKPILKDDDESSFYILLTNYLDAADSMFRQLEELGVSTDRIFCFNRSFFPFLSMLLSDTSCDVNVCEIGSAGVSTPISPLKKYVGPGRLRISSFDPDVNDCNQKNSEDIYYESYPMLLDSSDNNPRYVYKVQKSGHIAFNPISEKFQNRFFPKNLQCEIGNLEKFKVDRTITLDSWQEKYGKQGIDFLYLNVDSSEFDVLLGGIKVLRNALMLEIEVYFNQLYENQVLFGDLDKLLRESGYELLDLYLPNKIGIFRDPFGFSDGQIVHMNAVYFKSDVVTSHDLDKLLKLVSLMEVKGHVSMAFQVMHEAYSYAVKIKSPNKNAVKEMIIKAYSKYEKHSHPILSLDEFLNICED